MTEHEHDSRRSAAADLIPESAARRIAEERRAESELVMVTDLLNQVPELRRDPGATVSDYIDGLVKRRAELLEQVGSAVPTRIRAQPADSLVARLGPFFTPWIAVNLPYFAEAVHQTPSQSGTSGDINTDTLMPGGVEFDANLKDAGTVAPNIPKWWVHAWWCSYVFPSPLTDSRLFYRFTTETSFDLTAASARPNTGSVVNAYATVGTTSDVEAAGPFDAPSQSAFAFWIPLPLPPFSLGVQIEDQPTNFTGSIEVQAGKNAAIGLIYGVTAGIASGTLINLGGGTMNTCLTLPPGTQGDGDPCDKIEYRFEPIWWVQAVNQRRQEAAGS